MNPNLLHILIGTWLVCSSNFPMWTKGNKTDPAFTYGLITKKDGSEALSDQVSYTRNKKTKFIKGVDHPVKKDSAAFVWRGKGLLSLLKSSWRVALLDPAHQWAVVYFSKTAFTPEGVDIISRQKLPEEIINNIRSKMLRDPLLAKHVSSLKNL
jgi:hypothetical protein